jgi:hypothetical protein
MVQYQITGTSKPIFDPRREAQANEKAERGFLA